MPVSLSQKEKIWESVLELVKEAISDRHVYDSFFASTKLHKIEDNKFIIVCDSKLSITLINSKYLPVIENAVKNVTETIKEKKSQRKTKKIMEDKNEK